MDISQAGAQLDLLNAISIADKCLKAFSDRLPARDTGPQVEPPSLPIVAPQQSVPVFTDQTDVHINAFPFTVCKTNETEQNADSELDRNRATGYRPSELVDDSGRTLNELYSLSDGPIWRMLPAPSRMPLRVAMT